MIITAFIVLGGLLAGTIAAAIALGYKAGSAKGDLTVARDAGGRAIAAALNSEASADERIRRKDLVISGLKAKLRGLREKLQSDPDPAVRGSVAVDSIIELLAEFQNVDDADPGSDHEAGQVSPSE